MEHNVIYNEDNLVTLSRMPDNSVDLIITSPPYNKGFYATKNAQISGSWSKLNGRKIAYDVCSDEMLPEDYEEWQRRIIEECIRVLKPSGSLFYNHKDIIYKGRIVPPKWVYDFKVRQQIVWDRANSPMIDPHYFLPVTEWIYWIVKDEKKVYFDREKSALRTSIWRMGVDKNPHPAPFPIMMAKNIIACASPEGALIYDPFMGSGTTALATLDIGGGRSYIGSEISEKYCTMAENRIKLQTAQLTLF